MSADTTALNMVMKDVELRIWNHTEAELKAAKAARKKKRPKTLFGKPIIWPKRKG